MMKYKFAYLLNVVLYVLVCISCSKDENNNSNNFATGIVELPALRNGANDVFVTHYTTFNGQKVTSFSMEYDKSKKHSRWIAFRFDNQTKQQNVSRSDEPFDADLNPEKPDVPLNKNDAFQKVQKRRVQEKR